jgi:hypothetical protein
MGDAKKAIGSLAAVAVLLVVLLFHQGGHFVFPWAAGAREGQGPPEDDRQPVARAPDAGPRADARRQPQELGGMRIRILKVWISKNIDNGVMWYRTSYPLLKVRLHYLCLPPHKEIKFRNHDAVLNASAVYDDKDRQYQGRHPSSPLWVRTLAQGYPTEETIYFEAPKPGFAFLDLDYAAEFLPPGQLFRFRIPADMVELTED